MVIRKIVKSLKLFRQRRLFKKFISVGILNDIDVNTVFSYADRISIGSYVYIGPGGNLNGLGKIEIKDGVIIGPNLTIHSANHKYKDAKYIPYDETFDFRKVVIEENVWIGGNVIITPGSHIGEGCIIGAGCVVSGKIPHLSVVVGNPCKIIKTRDSVHYDRLKKENKIYLKNKKERNFVPDINTGFYD